MLIYILLCVAFACGLIATLKYVTDIGAALLLSILCGVGFMFTLGVSCEKTDSTTVQVLKIKDKAILNNALCLQVETYNNPLIFKTYEAVSILVNEEKIEKVTRINVWGNCISYYYQSNGTILE